MTIQLSTIRYFDDLSVYHYTRDNEPLQDLEQNDEILKGYIEALLPSAVSYSFTGNWTSLVATIPVPQTPSTPFAYRLKVWAVQDYSAYATQTMTITERVVIGYVDSGGGVSIDQTNTISTQSITTTVGLVIVSNGSNIEISFTGYSGSNGLVKIRVEQFGI